MALPITVPFTFANATTTQNLSSLDADFATVYNAVNGIGNGTVSLSNVNVTGGNISNVTFSGVVASPENGYQRNRIINGAMVIDQRNAGGIVTQTTANLYGVDRFQGIGSVTSKFTFQQSTTAPTGYVNSTLITSSAATTPGATDFYVFGQLIEGLNITDLAWGTANAATVTLSFWVRSSLTGTFGGSIQNSDNTRNYPFTYTISAANTWEQKTVTVAGDTSGTWLTTNGVGMKVRWSMGAGATVSGPAGAWSGTLYYSATGATSVVGTSGATFYITGVQLEVGSVATPFERRQYGQELMLCQRYYYKTYDVSTVPGTVTNIGAIGSITTSVGASYTTGTYKTTMRTSPTVTIYNGSTGGTGTWRDGGASDVSVTVLVNGSNGFLGYTSAASASSTINGQFIASAEL